MEIPEILQTLEFNNGIFPQHSVNEAIARKEEITPPLLQILKRARTDIDQLVQQSNYMAHIYAMYLLAQFREKKAYPLLIDFLSIPGEDVMTMAANVVTEDMGQILASVYDGDLDSMKKLIENREANEYVRSAALRGMTTLVANGIENREEVLDYFKELFQGKLERDASIIWYSLTSSSIALYPDVVQEEIKSAFDDGLVCEFFSSRHHAEQAIEVGKEKTLANLLENRKYKLIEDTMDEMSWWACFSQDSKKNGGNKLLKNISRAAPKKLGSYNPSKNNSRLTPKKIGRNEPCPCGSGKKYKKCCGA